MERPFFVPEDFISRLEGKPLFWPDAWQQICDAANEKLELEGRKVWGFAKDDTTEDYFIGRWCETQKPGFYGIPTTYTALLINVEKRK